MNLRSNYNETPSVYQPTTTHDDLPFVFHWLKTLSRWATNYMGKETLVSWAWWNLGFSVCPGSREDHHVWWSADRHWVSHCNYSSPARGFQVATHSMLIDLLESGTKCHLCKQRGLTVSLSFLRNYGNVLVLGGMTDEETSSAGCPVLLFLKH